MIDFEFVVFNDHNPFLIFNTNGHVVYSNKAAEYLITINSIETIYQLALKFAPSTYGSKYSLIDIEIDIFNFFAINVLYENDDFISIILYMNPPKKEEITLNGFILSDINLLLKTNIDIFKMQTNTKLTIFSDLDLPPFQINQNNLSLLIQKILENFKDTKEFNISLSLKIGQKIIIENKKYPIVSLIFKTNKINIKNKNEIIKLSKKNYSKIYINEKYLELDIPMLNN